MMNREQDGASEYVAFISYAREDEAFAKHLESEIEAHTRPGGARAARVFRDRSDFTGSVYESALEGHLRSSATLLVVCSPSARKSTFVSDEIRRFARLNGVDRIFPVLVSGLADNEADDQKAFPPALLEVMQGRGMPLGAEYRGLAPLRERISAGRFEAEWYKLLGNIYGVSPADIRDQDQRRQVSVQRRRLAASAAVVVVLVAALGGAVWLWQRAVLAEGRAEKAEGRASEMNARVQTELRLRDRAQAELGSAFETLTKPPTGGPTPPVAGPAPVAVPSARVYFHIRNQEQRPGAESMKKAIEQQIPGLVVPGIERLDVGPTRTSELRFFRDGDRAEADRIGQVLRDAGASGLAVKKIPGFETSTRIRPGHFELWLMGDGGAGP